MYDGYFSPGRINKIFHDNNTRNLLRNNKNTENEREKENKLIKTKSSSPPFREKHVANNPSYQL